MWHLDYLVLIDLLSQIRELRRDQEPKSFGIGLLTDNEDVFVFWRMAPRREPPDVQDTAGTEVYPIRWHRVAACPATPAPLSPGPLFLPTPDAPRKTIHSRSGSGHPNSTMGTQCESCVSVRRLRAFHTSLRRGPAPPDRTSRTPSGREPALDALNCRSH